MKARRTVTLAVCFGIPMLILAASYLWLAVHHGTPRLWSVVVHESGRYTLGETVFYFGHFLREVPIAMAYVLFLLGCSGAVGPSRPASRRSARAAPAALLGAGALIGAALVLRAAADGWSAALLDLFQYRTRDDLVGYGTHWRYHWLSTVWFGAILGLAPTTLNRVLGRPVLAFHRSRTMAAWGYFVLLSLVFGLSADVFVDVRYAGHQAREIMTHGPVTLLLGLGMLLAAGGTEVERREAVRGRARMPSTSRRRSTGWLVAASAVLAVTIPLYLASVSLGGDVMEHGQSDHGLAAMVAAHYFEHTLDYSLVFLLLTGSLARVKLRSDIPATRRTIRREQRSNAHP